jgi:hypothetical protein
MLNAGRDNATVLFIWECPVGSSTKKNGRGDLYRRARLLTVSPTLIAWC